MYKEKRRVSSELRPDLGGCWEYERVRFKDSFPREVTSK